MENKKILAIKHHPMNVKFSNSFYLNQLGDVNPNEVVFIDVTSRNKDKEFIKEISPFFMGPVKSSDGKTAKVLENMWQFGKVYEGKTIFNRFVSPKKVVEEEFIASDKDGNPTFDWFKYREFGYAQERAYRHPFKGKPIYYYYVEDGKVKRLSYIEARKKVLFTNYIKLVKDTKAYKYLKSLVDSGKTIALVDFDAYNYYNKDWMKAQYQRDSKRHPMSCTVEDYLNINTVKDVTNFPYILAGQAFVLKMMLQGDIDYENEHILDHLGILD